MTTINTITMEDDYKYIPKNEKAGVYYVTKTHTINTFEFGQDGNEYPDVLSAHAAMQEYVDNRADKNKLSVQYISR